jgi:hypothetical protein
MCTSVVVTLCWQAFLVRGSVSDSDRGEGSRCLPGNYPYAGLPAPLYCCLSAIVSLASHFNGEKGFRHGDGGYNTRSTSPILVVGNHGIHGIRSKKYCQ